MNRTNQHILRPDWLESMLDFLLQAWRLSRGTVPGKIALGLVLGGVNAITGNWIQAMISAAWEEAFGKPIKIPEVSPLFGVFLVLLGVGVWVADVWFRVARERQNAAPGGSTIAVIRHESMEALTQPLRAVSLPTEMADADICSFPINQSPLYEHGILTASGAEAAVRMQSDLLPGIRRMLADKPDAKIVYYGKAHIPFVFLAGHSLSTGWPVRLYELDRQKGNWWAIDEKTSGDDLGFQLAILRTVFDSAVAARVLHFYSCVAQRNSRMEMARATDSECTCDFTPNQETTTHLHRPLVGTPAHASRPCHVS